MLNFQGRRFSFFFLQHSIFLVRYSRLLRTGCLLTTHHSPLQHNPSLEAFLYNERSALPFGRYHVFRANALPMPTDPPTMFPMPRTGLLLIAHGSREPEANADLLYLVTQVRNRGCYSMVEAAFLELAEPNIIEGGTRCVEQGGQRVLLVPYFLSAGVHVRRDLALARQQLSDLHPNVEFRLAEPLGRHPLLVDIVCQRASESSRSLPTSG